jgi:hypothetical protein
LPLTTFQSNAQQKSGLAAPDQEVGSASQEFGPRIGLGVTGLGVTVKSPRIIDDAQSIHETMEAMINNKRRDQRIPKLGIPQVVEAEAGAKTMAIGETEAAIQSQSVEEDYVRQGPVDDEEAEDIYGAQ